MVIVYGGPFVICCLILFINVKQSMMSLVTLPAQLLRACVHLSEWLQAIQTESCLTQLRHCILMNLSHLKSRCDALHTGHCNCVATLVYIGLLTLPPVACERGLIAVDFSDWVV